jgi:N-acylglucosamine 2-epimerase
MDDPAQLRELARFYRKHLLVDILPFWEARTRDTECGGYLTCFDRAGQLTDPDKYIWFQGRQLWMFSALYNRVEKDPKWLELARHGRDFIVKHAYAGDGRFYYHLDRRGQVKEGTISIYTDHFVLSGLVEYAIASGRDDDLPLIRTVYDTLERSVYDRDFKDLYHSTWSPRYQRHGLYMMSVHVAGLAEQVLGRARTTPLVDHSLEKILYVFAKDEHQALFESVARDGTVIDEPEGRVVYPGHTLESMWFCMHAGLKREERALVDRALTITDWAYRAGHDTQYGGIFSYVDAFSGEPEQTTWFKETGMAWHDKAFWVHSESLYTLALAAAQARDPAQRAAFWRGFLDLHAFCQKYFFDPEYGEWYTELFRDGRPKLTDKGTIWKAAYHVPRGIMFTALLLERLAEQAAPAAVEAAR